MIKRCSNFVPSPVRELNRIPLPRVPPLVLAAIRKIGNRGPVLIAAAIKLRIVHDEIHIRARSLFQAGSFAMRRRIHAQPHETNSVSEDNLFYDTPP